jgi:hypothetical protein
MLKILIYQTKKSKEDDIKRRLLEKSEEVGITIN